MSQIENSDVQSEQSATPRVEGRSRNARHRPCPVCKLPAPRCGIGRRILHDLGDAARQQPVDLSVAFSKHRCKHCDRIFNTDLSDLAPPKCQYTCRVQRVAVQLVLEQRFGFRSASRKLWSDYRVLVPWATIQNWVEMERRKRRNSEGGHKLR